MPLHPTFAASSINVQVVCSSGEQSAYEQRNAIDGQAQSSGIIQDRYYFSQSPAFGK